MVKVLRVGLLRTLVGHESTPPGGQCCAGSRNESTFLLVWVNEEVVPHSGMYQLMCWLKRGVLVVRSWFRTSGKHFYFCTNEVYWLSGVGSA